MFENFDWLEAMRKSPVMLIILACSVITFGYALERILYYWKRRQDAEGLMQKVSEQVRSGLVVRMAVLYLCAGTRQP